MNERDDHEVLPDRETDDLARIIRAAGRRPTPPQADYDAVFTAAHAAWQTTLRRRGRRHFSLALAASLLVAVAVTALLRGMNVVETPLATTRLVAGNVTIYSATKGEWLAISSGGREIKRGDRLRTSADGRVELELDPSISLRLAGATELEFDTEHSLRMASGAVYVDSGRDAGRNPPPAEASVRIDTPFGTLRDIGTRFEVRVSDEQLRLRVRSGRVELHPPSGSTEVAGAEQQLEMTRGGEIARSRFSARDSEWRWAEDLAVVPLQSGQPVDAYLAWVAAEMERQLEYDAATTRLDAELDRFNGDPQGLTPAELLGLIDSGATNFGVTVTDDSISVTRTGRR